MAEGQNAQLFIKLSARYRDSNQIMIYTDCNCIKGSFDEESLKNPLTGSLKGNYKIKMNPNFKF